MSKSNRAKWPVWIAVHVVLCTVVWMTRPAAVYLQTFDRVATINLREDPPGCGCRYGGGVGIRWRGNCVLGVHRKIHVDRHRRELHSWSDLSAIASLVESLLAASQLVVWFARRRRKTS